MLGFTYLAKREITHTGWSCQSLSLMYTCQPSKSFFIQRSRLYYWNNFVFSVILLYGFFVFSKEKIDFKEFAGPTYPLLPISTCTRNNPFQPEIFPNLLGLPVLPPVNFVITSASTHLVKCPNKLINNFSVLSRFKVLGPDGSLYVLGQEVQMGGGSDADDAWLALICCCLYLYSPWLV